MVDKKTNTVQSVTDKMTPNSTTKSHDMDVNNDQHTFHIVIKCHKKAKIKQFSTLS